MPELVYITAPDMTVARLLAEVLVSERLVAGVNIMPAMQSIYHWQGKIEQHAEVALFAQTTLDSIPQLMATVKEHHPYTTPCIVHWPIQGHGPFLDWIKASTLSTS